MTYVLTFIFLDKLPRFLSVLSCNIMVMSFLLMLTLGGTNNNAYAIEKEIKDKVTEAFVYMTNILNNYN